MFAAMFCSSLQVLIFIFSFFFQTGEGVKDARKGQCANHVSSMANFLKVTVLFCCSFHCVSVVNSVFACVIELTVCEHWLWLTARLDAHNRIWRHGLYPDTFGLALLVVMQSVTTSDHKLSLCLKKNYGCPNLKQKLTFPLRGDIYQLKLISRSFLPL